MEITLQALGKIPRDATQKVLVFAKAHGGDVGEFVVFVDEAGVGVRRVAASRENVEDSDRVARSEPIRDGDRERKGCVVAVRGEEEDLQGVAPV